VRRWALVAAPILFVALLLAAWELACRVLAVPEYFLPTPSAIFLALVSNAPLLFVSAWRTLSTALMASARVAEASFRPIAIALQVTPIIAIAPLFTVWAGIDHPELAVVALACVAAFFPMYSGALAGLSAADPELERLFDLYGATAWQRLTRLKLPSAVPQAMEGFKVGLGLALVGAVIGEMLAGSGNEQGLAWRILEASHRMEMPQSFAAVVALGLMAGVLHAGFQALERRLTHWWRGR
jgi:NitT/TauT family transport system permease protein